MGRLLDEAAATLRADGRAPAWPDVGLSQRLRGKVLDGDILRAARGDLEGSFAPHGGPWGFSFVAQVSARLDPAGTIAWIGRRRVPVAAARLLVIALAGRLWRAGPASPTVAALLRSASPALRALAAYALTHDFNSQGPRSVRKAWDTMRGAGLKEPEAHWLAAQALKEQAHMRYGVRRRLEDLENDQRLVRRLPARAPGGSAQAPEWLRRYEREIPRAEADLAAADARLEVILQELSEVWPEEGLTPDELHRLDPVFVRGQELRLPMAEALPPGPHRNQLLERNILDYAEMIGCVDLKSAFDDCFFKPEGEVFHAARYAACSIRLRYEQDKIGPGQRTSRLLAPLASAADEILNRPFAAARFPVAQQAALSRLACGLVLALEVVLQCPDEDLAAVDLLSGHALSTARRLFSYAQDDELAAPYLDHLALMAVMIMARLPAHDRRADWALDESLTPAARALAMWSDSAAAAANPSLAETLFAAAAQPALRTRVHHYGFGRAVSLLDVAAGTARAAAATSLLALLRSLWAAASQAFAPYECETSLGDMLINAAAGDAAAETALVADRRLGTGFVARALRV